MSFCFFFFFFFQAEDGIRDHCVTGVQTCALPICAARPGDARWRGPGRARRWSGSTTRPPGGSARTRGAGNPVRSEEHTSELQSHSELVCRLLLEKKKPKRDRTRPPTWSYAS